MEDAAATAATNECARMLILWRLAGKVELLKDFRRPFTNVDIQITDRQNVDKMTENVDFNLFHSLAPQGLDAPFQGW
jgi:hypothetical protein